MKQKPEVDNHVDPTAPQRDPASPPPIGVEHDQAEEQKIPFDLGYGTNGYAYFTSKERPSVGEPELILASRHDENRFYVAAWQENRGTHTLIVFITCLDRYGKEVSSFGDRGKFHFDTETARYNFVTAVAEDTTGNLLVAASTRNDAQYLWKLTPAGKPDESFGQGKGYVNVTDMLGYRFGMTHLVSFETNWFIITASPSTDQYGILALDEKGERIMSFGVAGHQLLQAVIPEKYSYFYGTGMAVISAPGNQNRLVFSAVAHSNGIAHCLTCALTKDGELDTSFGENGIHTSDPDITPNGMSVTQSPESILLYGYRWNASVGAANPIVYRLTPDGKPDKTFNHGNIVIFEKLGGWNAMIQYKKMIVGFGGFYTRSLAVRYNYDGTLDKSFMPPDGHGQLGDIYPSDGFFVSSGSMSIAIDSGKQRMLFCGNDEQHQNGYNIPCVIAISLKPE
ncbi:hypothetical protein [Pseudomonas putida]|uniref:Delta-60 repeat domain-containing protein n=1 Tax=Pseudomonas putida TaxID=303 RepID=A0AAD0PH21_PSEPU|nr:hypothetical protein [Pseudomonas putida]AXA26257.1 hypothetical protein C1S65_19870 [Pseudomonas putida]